MKQKDKLIKGVIFDLDGTLINSIEDIKDSLNIVLSHHAHPVISTSKCTELVGSGLSDLVRESLPAEHRTDSYIKSLVLEMRDEYAKRWLNKTSVYDGIPALLSALSSHGIILTVLSNKVQQSTLTLVNTLLSNWNFSVIAGATEDRPLKPYPESVRFILEKTRLSSDEMIFIGDGKTDVLAAKSVNMKVIAVSWGYRNKQALKRLNPDYLLDHPKEILKVLL